MISITNVEIAAIESKWLLTDFTHRIYARNVAIPIVTFLKKLLRKTNLSMRGNPNEIHKEHFSYPLVDRYFYNLGLIIVYLSTDRT